MRTRNGFTALDPRLSGWALLSQIGLCLQHILRFLHLQVIPRATAWKSDRENAKVVLFADCRVALLSTLLHVLPLAAVLTLIVINARSLFIGEVSATTITALQFCAKLLEVLAQASITTILLGLIRQQAIASDHLSLGDLLAPHRVTDVSYLWSLDFWGAFTAKRMHNTKRAAILLATVIAVILAALVGPSSAIAMIPRQVTFQISKSLVLGPQPSLLYPDEVSLQDGQVANEAAVTKDLDQISERVVLSPYFGTLPIMMTDERSRNMYRSLSHWSGIAKPNYLYYAASIPHQASTWILASDSVVFNSADTPPDSRVANTAQPYVYQTCNFDSSTVVGPVRNVSSRYIPFGEGYPELNHVLTYADLWFDKSKPTSDYCQEFTSLGVSTSTQSTQDMGWCSTTLPPANHSLLTVTTWIEPSGTDDDEHQVWSRACVTRAQWVKAKVDFASSSTIAAVVDDLFKLNSSAAPFINIHADWAKRAMSLFLNTSDGTSTMDDKTLFDPVSVAVLAIALSNAGPNSTQGEALTDVFGGPDGPSAQSEALLSYLDANDRFKKYGENVGVWGSNTTDITSLTPFEVESSVQGYGYDTSATTVRLSLAVLATYVLIATSYICYILASGRVGTSWDSIGELVMLSLNSKKPSHLRGTSVGVDTLSTYGQLVNIRINKENSAEIVFENDPDIEKGGYTLVEVNKKYL